MTGKRILIAGTGNNLGFFTAKVLLKSGFSVTLNSRNDQKLSHMADELDKYGRVDRIAGDLSRLEVLKSIGEHLLKTGDVLGGIAVEIGGYASDSVFSTGSFDEMVHNNIKVPATVLSYFSGILPEGSPVVFITSVMSSRRIATGSLSYSISKSALNRFIEISAKSLTGKGIRVNGIAAPVIEEKDHENETVHSKLGSENVDPELIANTISFLMGDLSSGITGNIIYVDNGSSL